MRREYLIIKSASAPTVEVDTSASAAYVRFSSAKVCKTVPLDRPRVGAIVMIDLDANNEVVGVEFVGVKEFSVRALMERASVKTPNIDLNRTRYVRAASKSLVNA